MSRFNTPPLPRHESLKPLSRDHYMGLVAAQHLLKSAAKDAAERRAAVAEFVDHWRQEISPHFEDEQRLLGPLLDEPQQERLHAEHDSLRELAEEARAHRHQVDPGADFVTRLGSTLNEHIRWEERELFPAVERTTSPADLARLGVETAKLEVSRPRSSTR